MTHSQTTLDTNSFMYTYDSSSLAAAAAVVKEEKTISPKDYQKRSSNSCLRQNNSKKVITKPSKKIILGKPITSKQQKMSLQELKALSRQIRPLTSSTNNKSNDNIILISKNLRENLFKAKSKMMDSLKKSSTPKDVEIYEYLNKENICPAAYLSSSSSSSTTSSDNEDDDDCNSVDSSIQLKLVTNESGSVSLVPTTGSDSSQSSNSTVSSYDDEDFMPLYTPDYSCTMNMDFFGGLEQPEWLQAKSENNTDMVTEDQINSWLQRGGFGDHMSPITMATDQELADLLDFDM